mgnify:FL=1
MIKAQDVIERMKDRHEALTGQRSPEALDTPVFLSFIETITDEFNAEIERQTGAILERVETLLASLRIVDGAMQPTSYTLEDSRAAVLQAARDDSPEFRR